jgi:hypothetical protein
MDHEVLLRTSTGRHRLTIDDSIFTGALSEVQEANREAVKLLIASYLTLISDSPLDPRKPKSTYKKFLAKLHVDGLRDTLVRFTSLAHKLVSQPVGQKHTSIGVFLAEFKDTPVFREYLHFYKTGDVAVVRYLYTFLNFGKKFEYADASFNEVALRDWIHNEERLRDQVLPQDILVHLKNILRVSLPTFEITDFRPKFGPGTVAERGIKRRLEKIRHFSYDTLLDRVFFHGHIGKYGDGKNFGLTADQVIPDPKRWGPETGISSRISRLAFVPKSVKTSRSICQEPNTLMFFQQGVLDTMVRLLESSILRHSVKLHDQTFNQRLSQFGSKTGLIDTIDLSAASDSLSYDLVKAVFPPSWQIVMRATRSSQVQLPDGSLFSIKKFAPMGSALCFPTQCIVYWAVGVYAACLDTYANSGSIDTFSEWLDDHTIRAVMRSFHSSPSPLWRSYQPLGIYGDDICVDSVLTPLVISTLTSLGFVVNAEKSFTGNQLFRESCGKFYLKGHDVSPLYFTVKGVRNRTNPEHISSHVHLLNECYKRSYRNTYRFLRHSILTWNSRNTWNPIPHVSNPDFFGILCSQPTNNYLATRENKNYQRTEIKVWTISWMDKYPPGDLLGAVDNYSYMRWWVGRRSKKSSEVHSSVLPYDTGRPGLRWRWIPSQ